LTTKSDNSILWDMKTTNNYSSDSDDLFFTRIEAAKVARISKSTLDRKNHAGEIPCKRMGRRVLFPKAAFLAWCATPDVGGSAGSSSQDSGPNNYLFLRAAA
jgi:excisionase family DNA binding protein